MTDVRVPLCANHLTRLLWWHGSHALRPLEFPGVLFSCPERLRSLPDLDLNALLSAKEAAQYAGVSVAAICKWRERGHLPVATDERGQEIRDKQGRPRYRLLDVAKAENATKRRGEQMARGITRRDPEQRLAA
jgi:hypothetical protein